MSAILFATVIQAQRHTEAEYRNGFIKADPNTTKINGSTVLSDTIYNKHNLFLKTKEWAHNNYSKIRVDVNENAILVENDYYSLIFNFDYKEVGGIYFTFTDKENYGRQSFTGKKQCVIADLVNSLRLNKFEHEKEIYR